MNLFQREHKFEFSLFLNEVIVNVENENADNDSKKIIIYLEVIRFFCKVEFIV